MNSPPTTLEEGLLLVSSRREGERPASFWRFEAAPPPGSGRTPVAAVAGLGLDGRAFRHLAPLARDRDLVLANLPNDLGEGRPTMEDLAREVLTALDAAGHADRPAVLLGSSLGGMVALAAALEAPRRAAALVLLGTGASWAGLPRRLHAVARLQGLVPRRPFPRLFAAFMLPRFKYADADLRAALRAQMLHRTKGFVGGALGAMRGFDAVARLGGVKAPALVVHGEADTVIPPAAGRVLVEGLPRGEWLSLPGCGHLPHLTHAPAVVEAVARFLEKEEL